MITHILKDGTVKKDITGHIVRKQDNPMIYEILKRREKNNEKGT